MIVLKLKKERRCVDVSVHGKEMDPFITWGIYDLVQLATNLIAVPQTKWEDAALKESDLVLYFRPVDFRPSSTISRIPDRQNFRA